MTFILGSVLFLLGGFFGMLIMAFAFSIRENLPPSENHPALRAVRDNE
jgi:hypothetical protein